ncbi:hypothetical protein NG726_01640 [Pseudomonas sp. MOB-449]|nr:hypothetical protein [Pseudomonas sp. MOB-449]
MGVLCCVRNSGLLIVAAIVFVVYLVYSLAYYGVVDYSGLNYVKAISFFALIVLFFSVFSVGAGYRLFSFILFLLTFSIVGVFVGIYHGAQVLDIVVHFLYFVFFMLAIFLGVEYGSLLFRSEKAVHFLLGSRMFWQVGLFLGLAFLIIVNLSRLVFHNPSITFPFLLLAFSFFLWRRSWFFLVVCSFAIVFSLKRGMWFSVLFLVAILGGRLFLYFSISRVLISVKAVWLSLLFAFVLIFSGSVGFFSGWLDPVIDNFVNRVMVTVPSDISATALDSASSGRVGDFVAVFSKVLHECGVFFGCGFGAEYDYFDYNPSWELTSTWVKSGSDILVLHFFLLFGVFGVMVSFVFLFVFLVACLCLAFIPWRSLEFFLLASYVLVFPSSLISFSFFDPMFPFVFGGAVVGLLRGAYRYSPAGRSEGLCR